jgi:transposase-like protein
MCAGRGGRGCREPQTCAGAARGATENAAAAKDLLRHLVEHGADPARRRLFIIDGWKALRTAINAVFGADTPVQRCRNHKLRNVLGGFRASSRCRLAR